jgi:glutaredoxin
MVMVYGKVGCSSCFTVKNILTNKRVPFNYVDLNTLPDDEKKGLIKKATKAGKMGLPIVLKDGEVVDFRDIN